MVWHKGKLVALTALTLGSLTLGWAGIAGWRPALERYYAWKLGSANKEERAQAAKRLIEMDSPLVVRFLIREFAEEKWGERGWEDLPSFQRLTGIARIPDRSGAAAQAARGLSDENPNIRRVSLWFLKRLGPAAAV